jgi:hypothetical protein
VDYTEAVGPFRTLCGLAFATAATVSCDGEGVVCGYGARATDGVCAPAPTLVVDVDERTDSVCRDVVSDGDGEDSDVVCTTRRGIGLNVCPVEAFDAVAAAAAVVGDCSLFTYAGRAPERTFAGDAGVVVVGLIDGAVTLVPAADSDCYDSDLLPSRDDLFLADDEMGVASLGGEDFAPFELTLRAPEPLAIERVQEMTRGEALTLRWVPAGADRVVVSVVTYDEDADVGARVTCIVDDDGEVTIDAALSAGLLDSDDTVQIFVLRQNGVHVENDDDDGVIEGAATVSDVVTAPLRSPL